MTQGPPSFVILQIGPRLARKVPCSPRPGPCVGATYAFRGALNGPRGPSQFDPFPWAEALGQGPTSILSARGYPEGPSLGPQTKSLAFEKGPPVQGLPLG